MKATATHYVDEFSTGERVAFRIDHDGDVEILTPRHSDGNVWIRPADMARVMTALGFRVDAPDKPAERTPDASARVRASWLRSAAEDDTERGEIAAHATRARLIRAQRERALERARQERARLAGPRFFRDRDGDVWVTNPTGDGRLRLHRMRNGHAPEVHEWNAAARIGMLHGPLVDITRAELEAQRAVNRAAREVDYVRRYGVRRPLTATNYFVQARNAGVQRYRDRRGRVWVNGPDPDRLHPLYESGARGRGFRRDAVERIMGPLRREETAAEGIVAALRAQVQRDMDNSMDWMRR